MKRLLLCLVLLGCGSNQERSNERDPNTPADSKIAALEKKVLELAGTAAQISGLINSDYKTCPNSGDTTDVLIRKICQVAQAATVELQVELTSRLGAFSSEINGQLAAINDNLSTLQATDGNLQASIDSINSSISTINSTLTTLDSRLDDAESAIDALEVLTSSLSTSVSGAMQMVEIGTENLGIGPFRESLLRRTDKTRINAYVRAVDAAQGFGNNPLAASNGSSTLVATLTAHGYSVGDVVELSGLAGSRGFSNGHIYGRFTLTATTANTFTFSASVNATSGGSLGGALGTARRIVGENMGTIWVTADGADVAVRQTTLGKTYNFIIKSTGDVCYHKSTALASFATINAGGANISCK